MQKSGPVVFGSDRPAPSLLGPSGLVYWEPSMYVYEYTYIYNKIYIIKPAYVEIVKIVASYLTD